MTTALKLGDKVRPKDGGVLMTIDTFQGKNHESALCMWLVDGVKHSEAFPISQITYVGPTATDPSSKKFSRYEDGLDPRDISVQISELFVATNDDADAMIPGSVQEVLKMVLEKLKMDVVFVSEFIGTQRIVRQVESIDAASGVIAGQIDLLEATWCQRIVDGRLPQIMNNVPRLAETLEIPPTDLKIGSHLATPIILSDGRVYGTFCCFSTRVDEKLVERDLKNLQLAAKFAAEKLEKQA